MELLSEFECKLILAIADHNMSVSGAAKYLGHRGDSESIYNRIEKIKKRTGLNPRNFYDLHKLVESAKHQLGGFGF